MSIVDKKMPGINKDQTKKLTGGYMQLKYLLPGKSLHEMNIPAF
jgi:hypothetical protein